MGVNHHPADGVHQAEFDHRRIGRQMHLYTTDELVGAGMPLWLPRGAAIRDAIERYVVDEERRRGFLHVHTPPLARQSLYEISGHWDNFREDMFAPIPSDDGDLVLRPMSCPHHALVYRSEVRSYRDLPLRLAEMAPMARDERSGVLGGLNRVRTMTMNDGHIFCRADQIDDEVALALDMVEHAYARLGLKVVERRLSLRGPGGKYAGEPAQWERAEEQLRKALASLSLPWVEEADHAAFYGPKIDLQVCDARGREQTLSTVQLDFVMPERFGLHYIAPSGERVVPTIVHRSVVSTAERMVGHLLDVQGMSLAPWISPVQVAVLPMEESTEPACNGLAQTLRERGIRVEVWDSRRSISHRVRSAAALGVPWVGVVGAREDRSGSVAVRRRGEGKPVVMGRDAFTAEVQAAIVDRRPALSG